MQHLVINNKCIVNDDNLKPKFLFIDDYDEKYIAIKPINGAYDKSLWFPKDIVFKFDEKLFVKLEELFERGSLDDLAKMWEKAIPWEDSK